ncbi:non-ribosomal peptide synthetase [Ruminococcus flavefaciens]|nr:non-ribosomal peptide synthetase [Ruminococcus flavefaciens]
MEYNNIAAVIERFAGRNVRLWTENGKLKYKAANGTLSDDDIALLKANKSSIIEFLENEDVKIIKDEEHAFEPFALTEIQQAYMLGRSSAFDYGGVACHIYMELRYDELDPIKAEDIWNELIRRHPMLRTKMSLDGYQTVMKEADRFKVGFYDLRNMARSDQEVKRKEIKKELDHKIYDPESWPLYTVTISRTENDAIMHFSIEFLVADWLSIWSIISEFESRYFTPEKVLPEIDVTFRDYQIAEQKLRQGMKYYTDRKYWLERIENFPKAPELPVIAKNDKLAPRFERQQFLLESEKWEKFKSLTRKYGVTPTSAVMTAYGMCLAKWSQNKEFCLNLSILNRHQIHKDVNMIVGDFTASSLLEINCGGKGSFADKANAVNSRLFEDLDHRLFNGVQVLRELQKARGNGELMPYVFTSAIGLLTNEQSSIIGKMTDNGISQTPQVFLDCQAMDTVEGLNINLDSRAGIFPEGLITDFRKVFHELLVRLSENEELWDDESFEIDIPDWQRKEREAVNDTKALQEQHLLHEYVLKHLESEPEKLAVADAECEWSRAELRKAVINIKASLVKNGVGRGDIVAVSLTKSRWQMAACLGILSAGAAYVPLDHANAKKRSDIILRKTNAKAVITLKRQNYDESLIEICISELSDAEENELTIEQNSIDDLAYIIFTSGSTGEPKGVEISHKAAVNTIEAMNRLYDISDKDVIFQLSQLNFDLSVYDLFGVPSAGGAVIIPDAEQYKNPAHWAKLLEKYGVTVWNSVPALMQMLMIYLQYGDKKENIPLRLAFLSGDWIPTELPDQLMERFEGIRAVSLGGATEGGIWSIYHDCIKGEIKEKQLSSVPYGRPLPNQGYLVLDAEMKDCPVWVAGDLYITGESLANGYWKEKELTEKAFVEYDGNIIYNTGDRGCYHPGGEIEFLGRADNQVKLRGHRIELGEIEAVYKRFFDIQAVSCIICEKAGEKMLAAVYVPNEGCGEEVLKERDSVLKEWLPNYMIPSYDIKIDSLPLTANGKVDIKTIRKLAEETIKGVKKQSNDGNELTGLETDIAGIIKELLKLESIGADDDLYEAGANSLILSRAAGRLNQEVESSISFEEYLVHILNAPKIREIAEFICSKQSKAVDVSLEENVPREDALTYELCADSEVLIIVFNEKLDNDVREAFDGISADIVFVDTNLSDNDKAQLKGFISEHKEHRIYIAAGDHMLGSCLDIASELIEDGIIPKKVVMIESGEETEAEREMPYMGDMVYVVTETETEYAEEVREALEDICLGEIDVISGYESISSVIKELIS